MNCGMLNHLSNTLLLTSGVAIEMPTSAIPMGSSTARAHPTDDHLMPLFTAAAAGNAVTRLHESYAYGGLSMSAYGFA